MDILFEPMHKKNKPTVKIGDKFPNNNIEPDEFVEVTGYSTNQALTVRFPGGRKGYGSVLALRAGTIKPEGKKVTGEKVEGKPCVKCGETIRYAASYGWNTTGDCVNCKNVEIDKTNSAKTKHCQASIGIKDPYRKCYEQGFLAIRSRVEKINPYPVSELGKRCAWFAGFNDNSK